ncbi:sensor histidine kinase [Prevotella sp. kh1p2]|uniref:sensor histidine kinase n=1 Tax=Prevotella sp. kh1p2 TaxID=1761883 RepID=UPI000B89CA34|nr:histidine kinase [Prevotella sp. kh1p2]
MTRKSIFKRPGLLVLTIVWVAIFLMPIMFINYHEAFEWNKFMGTLLIHISLFIVFFANFLYLAPRYLMKARAGIYWLINSVLITSLAFFILLFEHLTRVDIPEVKIQVFYLLRDMFNMWVAGTVATAIVLSKHYAESEDIKNKAELERTHAELEVLRTQIGPHFLLNTLNNIYALTAINQDSAQKALLQLSGLLRHMLYETQEQAVGLENELEFYRNYINLMKIRLPERVELTFETSVKDENAIKIAPLIALPLLENAFKHGISPTQKSFIHFNCEADRQHISMTIENSNYPKSDADRSGHGIGLEHVRRRLELLYPGKYEWKQITNSDKTIYTNNIIIYDTELRNY